MSSFGLGLDCFDLLGMSGHCQNPPAQSTRALTKVSGTGNFPTRENVSTTGHFPRKALAQGPKVDPDRPSRDAPWSSIFSRLTGIRIRRIVRESLDAL
jgi:hypothetical protein